MPFPGISIEEKVLDLIRSPRKLAQKRSLSISRLEGGSPENVAAARDFATFVSSLGLWYFVVGKVGRVALLSYYISFIIERRGGGESRSVIDDYPTPGFENRGEI